MMRQDLRSMSNPKNKKINAQLEHKHTWWGGQVRVVNELLHINQIRPHRAVLA